VTPSLNPFWRRDWEPTWAGAQTGRMTLAHLLALAVPVLLAASRLLRRLQPFWSLFPTRLQPWIPVVVLVCAELPLVLTGTGSAEELVFQAALGVLAALGLIAPGMTPPPAGPSTSAPAAAALLVALLPLSVVAPLTVTSCATPQRAAVSVADVVNEVARRGDRIYAVSVDACNAAEVLAAHHRDLATAEKLVGEVRSRCDLAFAALEAARKAVTLVDDAVAKSRAGELSAADLARLAVAAREAVESAQAAHAELATFLRGLAK
jgi:hypothetical protein